MNGVVARLGILLLVNVATVTTVAAARVRIDVSPSNGRRDHLTPEQQNWLVSGGDKAEFEHGGLQVVVEATGNGGGIQANWWKGGLAHDATMTCDGVYVDGETGLRITIHGLSAGRHSLVSFHNSIWDQDLIPVLVRVNGSPTQLIVEPSRKVSDDAEATSAFVEFEVEAGQDAIVEFLPQSTAENVNPLLDRVIINGLEIDTVDPAKKAIKPVPQHGDEHVEQQPTLQWQSAKQAVAHDVYLGTDMSSVAAATPASPEYQGRQESSEFRSRAEDPFLTYYWRVDEVRGERPEDVTMGDVWRFRIRHVAFPGAEGYGRFARGGRGGRVIEVTNLNDSGPGSLRDAVEAEGPRTVVFHVGGLITLESKLVIHNPYITVAGQTAPGKGICIRKYNFGMGGTHDAIVRYVRVRPGNIAGVTLDGMGMAGTDHSIIDHCSISWTQDESFSSRAAKNITLQRTLISEALNIAGHKNYEKGKQHGYAASIGGDIGSFHHNLLAHCAGRNWSLAGGLDKASRHTGRLDIRNNVVYNWGHRTTDGGAMQVNFVNNYYKPGPASRVFHVLMPERELVHAFGPQEYYVIGNVMEGRYDAQQRLAGVVEPRDEPLAGFLVDQPFFDLQVETQSAEAVFENVLADVGCNVPTLDEHDQRVIEETRYGTTSFKGSVSELPGLPDSQEDVGGWDDYPQVQRPANWDSDHDGLPNAWETEHGLNPNSAANDLADANGDPDGDGYTNLEDYLNSLAVVP